MFNQRGINLEGDLGWYVERATVKDPPDLNSVIDNQFVDYAVQQLGKYEK